MSPRCVSQYARLFSAPECPNVSEFMLTWTGALKVLFERIATWILPSLLGLMTGAGCLPLSFFPSSPSGRMSIVTASGPAYGGGVSGGVGGAFPPGGEGPPDAGVAHVFAG